MDQVIERIKARVAAVDPNGPRKVLGVFQLDVNTGAGVEQWSECYLQKKVPKLITNQTSSSSCSG